ncbi:hypothetical protein TWF481_005521 [Arthrobotrys musiformis]|uniref:Transcription factor Iwr1 domain-containing protein n=1 Tax=Arthrobotrys musiformis TaxID=47236 RepID=A0AAV9WE01_9PEZI
MTSSPPHNPNGNRQVLRQGRTYVHPSTANRSSVTSSDSSSTGQSLPDVGNRQTGRRLPRTFWGLEEGSGGYDNGRYARGSTFRRRRQGEQETSSPQQDQPVLSSPPPAPPPPPGQGPPSSAPPSPPPPEDNNNHSPQNGSESPRGVEPRLGKHVFDPVSDADLEGLEVVGLRNEDGERIYPDARASSGSSTPERQPAPPPNRNPLEGPETRVTRRQNDLPVAIIPQTSMELERPNLITKRLIQDPEPPRSEPPKAERLAIEYYPLEDDEDDWTDEEPWHCSDGEWEDTYEYDSDEEEDFGCIGLFKEPYEEMLLAGKGFNLEYVEIVDNWPVPAEIKNLGYRMIGRLGDQEEEDDEDEDDEEEGFIGQRFKRNEDYKLLRKHRWLHGLNPVDDDDEWEDEDEDEFF